MSIKIAQSKAVSKKISELKLGDTFESVGQYYLITRYEDYEENLEVLHVNLITGQSCLFAGVTVVRPVDLILTEEIDE